MIDHLHSDDDSEDSLEIITMLNKESLLNS